MIADESNEIEDENNTDTAGGIKLCSVIIPEGKNPGDVFTYKDEADGLELEITVPPDGKAGDTMEILLDDEDDEIEAVSVALGPHVGNITLQMVTLLEGDKDDEDEVLILDEGEENPAGEDPAEAALISSVIAEEEAAIDDEEGDGTNFMVWPAGIELAQFLASPYATKLLENKKNALELGSGCGVSGMALMAGLAKTSPDAKVTFSDLAEALPLLTANVDENRETLVGESSVTCTSKELKWGSDASDEDLKKYDLIIAADVLYNSETEVIESLSSTINARLTDDGLVLMSMRWRQFDDERAFFARMESEFGYEFVNIKKYITDNGGSITTSEANKNDKDFEGYEGLESMASLSWKEYGNKECEVSNKFFSETKFKAKDGEEKCLNDIDEEDLAVMADGDFDDCELAFIQFFVGSKK